MGSFRSSVGFNGRGPKRWGCMYALVAVTVLFFLFAWLPLPTKYETHRSILLHHVVDITSDHLPTHVTPGWKAGAAFVGSTTSKYAYATFLASGSGHREDADTGRDDYFIATRILAYQVLHAPETRSTNNIPLVVLVNEDVPEAKRERLRRDGAIVWEPEAVDAKWIKTPVTTWQSVLAKLRLWELTQFERICFLDGDTVLTRSLDGVFNESAVQLQQSGSKMNAVRDDEGEPPRDYVFAGMTEMMQVHHYPPSADGNDYPNVNYLNAGFFVLQPSLELLRYYLSLTDTPDRFDPELPEQNLLNYAHRREGNMPWLALDSQWNMHYPSVQDLNGGVASLHEKWWAPVNSDLSPFLDSWRWRMEGFYEAKGTFSMAPRT